MSETGLSILWSCESALAVIKPAGVLTQAANRRAADPPDSAASNVIDSLELRLRAQLGRESEYLAFPHRLDRPVSGVMLVATTRRAANLLSSQFESRKVAKSYLACVAGNALDLDTKWTDWILKQPQEAKVDVVGSDAVGAKLCETVVEPLGYCREWDCTVLRLSPHTGRMHQLRIQAAHRGHPILGDEVYGGVRPQDAGEPTRFHPLRIALHAESISFHEPKGGRRVRIEAPLPEEMSRILVSL